jgi:hypothetical protein
MSLCGADAVRDSISRSLFESTYTEAIDYVYLASHSVDALERAQRFVRQWDKRDDDEVIGTGGTAFVPYLRAH